MFISASERKCLEFAWASLCLSFCYFSGSDYLEDTGKVCRNVMKTVTDTDSAETRRIKIDPYIYAYNISLYVYTSQFSTCGLEWTLARLSVAGTDCSIMVYTYGGYPHDEDLSHFNLSSYGYERNKVWTSGCNNPKIGTEMGQGK